MGKVNLSVIVTGKVQGVWFRKSTADMAGELGLCGWVRNLATGEVEATLEGEREAVEKMVKWLHQGPPLARVEKVETSERETQGLLPPFSQRPTR